MRLAATRDGVSVREWLLRPRGFWGTALQCLVVFLVMIPAMNPWLLTSPRHELAIRLIPVVGAAALSSLAFAHFAKTVVRVVRVGDARAFEAAAREAAVSLGYEPASSADGVIACRPRLASLPAAWLRVEAHDGEAVVTGANLAVRRFVNELGFQAA